MSTSLLLSILSLYIAGATMMAGGIVILRRKLKKLEFTALAVFWLLMGIEIGLFMGTRTLFWGLGYSEIDKILYYIGQIFVAAFFPPGAYYIIFKVTHRPRITRIMTGVAIILAILFLFFHYKDGAIGPTYSEWGSEYGPPPSARIWMLLMIPLFYSVVIYDLISQFIHWIRRRVFRSIEFWPSFGIFFIIIAGLGDELGLFKDWKLLLSRVLFALGGVIVFLFFTGEEVEKLSEKL